MILISAIFAFISFLNNVDMDIESYRVEKKRRERLADIFENEADDISVDSDEWYRKISILDADEIENNEQYKISIAVKENEEYKYDDIWVGDNVVTDLHDIAFEKQYAQYENYNKSSSFLFSTRGNTDLNEAEPLLLSPRSFSYGSTP